MAADGTLSRNQIRAIAALLEHRRIEDAASAVGVGLRTLHRWLLEDASFVLALWAA